MTCFIGCILHPVLKHAGPRKENALTRSILFPTEKHYCGTDRRNTDLAAFTLAEHNIGRAAARGESAAKSCRFFLRAGSTQES